MYGNSKEDTYSTSRPSDNMTYSSGFLLPSSSPLIKCNLALTISPRNALVQSRALFKPTACCPGFACPDFSMLSPCSRNQGHFEGLCSFLCQCCLLCPSVLTCISHCGNHCTIHTNNESCCTPETIIMLHQLYLTFKGNIIVSP